MRKVRVKICGITRLEDLYASVDAGANAVGFIVDVPSSPRNLTLAEAKALIDSTPIFVEKVVVSVFRSLGQLSRIYTELRPDTIQVHGGPLPEISIREKLSHIRLIRAVQVSSENSIDIALKSATIFDAVLADSHISGRYGGTGALHDWGISKIIRDSIKPKPLILAGGLSPENVGDAISRVGPYAVDVSSGVEEQPGVKDPQKIISFMSEVRKAELCPD